MNYDVKLDLLSKEIFKEDMFQSVREVFLLMSDTSRLKIFWCLCHSDISMPDIIRMIGINESTVAHHLRLLKSVGLVEHYRDGPSSFYYAAKSEKTKILHDMIEKFMEMSCPEFCSDHEQINESSRYTDRQVEIIKNVHDKLTEDLSKRITIENLAKEFCMNPTTLKAVFKDVYGKSVASHLKEHRMKKAAELFNTTDMTVDEVSREVGYVSHGKFAEAFREAYSVNPREYRKNTK